MSCLDHPFERISLYHLHVFFQIHCGCGLGWYVTTSAWLSFLLGATVAGSNPACGSFIQNFLCVSPRAPPSFSISSSFVLFFVLLLSFSFTKNRVWSKNSWEGRSGMLHDVIMYTQMVYIVPRRQFCFMCMCTCVCVCVCFQKFHTDKLHLWTNFLNLSGRRRKPPFPTTRWLFKFTVHAKKKN